MTTITTETPPPPTPAKPAPIRRAAMALAVWTAWVCIYGFWQSWVMIPEALETLNAQSQGAVSVNTSAILAGVAVTYALLAAVMAWLIRKIMGGTNWARYCIAINFVASAFMAAFTPHEGLAATLAIAPDLGLQAYALYLLFAPTGRDWFQK